MANPYVVDVIVGHPLSLQMTHIEEQLQCGEVPITSIHMGIEYLRLIHNGLEEQAKFLVEDEGFKWQPYNGQLVHFVRKEMRKVSRPSVQFELRLDRVIESVLSEQLKDSENTFRRYLERVIAVAGDRSIEFRAYGSENDKIMSLGHSPVVAVSPENEGFNIYGEALARVTENFRRGQLDFELEKFFNPDAFKSRFKRSILVISDSQAGHLASVGYGSQVVAVSGAKYGDIANVIRSGEYDLDEYGLIIIYCGTNCYGSRYRHGERSREFFDLKDLLGSVTRGRPEKSVLFSCAFNHPDVLPENQMHMDFVERHMLDVGVVCFNWNNFPDPFLDQCGRPITKYFRDNIHLNAKGSVILFQHWCKVLKKLRYLTLTVSDSRLVIPKSRFERHATLGRRATVYDNENRSRSPVFDPKAMYRPEESVNRDRASARQKDNERRAVTKRGRDVDENKHECTDHSHTIAKKIRSVVSRSENDRGAGPSWRRSPSESPPPRSPERVVKIQRPSPEKKEVRRHPRDKFASRK